MRFGVEAGAAGEREKHRFTNYWQNGESDTNYAVNRQYQASSGRSCGLIRLPETLLAGVKMYWVNQRRFARRMAKHCR